MLFFEGGGGISGKGMNVGVSKAWRRNCANCEAALFLLDVGDVDVVYSLLSLPSNSIFDGRLVVWQPMSRGGSSRIIRDANSIIERIINVCQSSNQIAAKLRQLAT